MHGQNLYLDYFIDLSFEGVNIDFVLSFKDNRPNYNRPKQTRSTQC